jgi:hypothetical protein
MPRTSRVEHPRYANARKSAPGRIATAEAIRPGGSFLHLSLLGDLQRVVNLDAEVPNGALELGVAQEKLHRP